MLLPTQQLLSEHTSPLLKLEQFKGRGEAYVSQRGLLLQPLHAGGQDGFTVHVRLTGGTVVQPAVWPIPPVVG